jgi:sugar phosphate isomerase/epimerase
MQLGVNLTFAGKRWPEASAWSRLVAEMGISHVQFSFDLADPELSWDLDRYVRLRTEAAANGVQITSAFTGGMIYVQNFLGDPDLAVRDRAEAWYRRAIAAAARLGASSMGGHMGAISVREWADRDLREARQTAIVEAVLRLSAEAAGHGLDALLWEIMPVIREYPATMETVAAMLERCERSAAVPVELCLDVGHACRQGADDREASPYEWLERFGPQTRCVHLQQTDGRLDRHWPFTEECNRQGIIEPARVVEILRRSGRATVELMLEPIPAPEVSDAQVEADVRASVEHWRPMLADPVTPPHGAPSL